MEDKKIEEPMVVEEEVVEAKPQSKLRNFYADKYPEKSFEDDLALMDDAAEELSTAHSRLSDYEQANETLMDVLEEYPEFAEIIDDVKSGMDFRVALAKHFDPEDLRVEEDDDAAENYKKTVEDRKRRKQEAADRIAERARNWEDTKGVFASTREELGWSEEKDDGFGKWLSDSINDIAMGKITPELMRKLRQGYIYEEAVQQAREDGEIEGKNAAIEAKRVKAAESGDNMPTGSAGATKLKDNTPKSDDPFGDVESLINKRSRKW